MTAPLPFDGASPSAGLELDGLAPADVRALFAECRDCERVECFPSSAGLPAGWKVAGAPTGLGAAAAALCPDCVDNARKAEAGGPIGTPGHVFVGFRLTRAIHAVAGFATLRLHGGRDGRRDVPDVPAQFLVDRATLRDLINQLEAIDAELSNGENHK